MKFDPKEGAAWLKDVTAALPGLDEALRTATSDVLVIGAGVFDIYFMQGWIPQLKRKTGDLDLSVGLVSGKGDYEVLKAGLLKSGYVNRGAPYRYFPSKVIPGAVAYIDLLAHSDSSQVSDEQARAAMGAGPDFSLTGMGFASKERLQIAPRVYCPNPLGMVFLKMTSYRDNPTKRIKDLADIAELGWGLVNRGQHFEMKSLWTALASTKESQQVKKMLSDLSSGESVEWDLEDARRELLGRSFTNGEVETDIPANLKEWADYLY